MTDLSLSFDRATSSLDAVQRAAYRFSDRISCDIVERPDVFEVRMYLIAGSDDPEVILGDFRNEVLDQVLRARIRAETADVRNLVLALAFSKTGLAEGDV